MEKEKLLWCYEKMVLSRCYENTAVDLNKKKRIIGSIHAGQGEEACGVGIVSAMKDTDILSPSYRDVSAAIAKGATMTEMTGLLYGKQCGMSNGRTRILHVGDLDRGMLPGNPILGASTGVAIGAAFASQMDKTGKVVVNIMGDGACNEGAVYESMNFASVFKLPIVFVIVNNHYAWSTPTDHHNNLTIIAERALAYNMPSYVADGNDLLEVNKIIGKCVESAREGNGPAFVELRTYRWSGHSGNDKNVYRSDDERTWYYQNDPIRRVRDYILAMGYKTEEELTAWDKKLAEEVEEAYEYARNSEDPKPEDVLDVKAMLYME